MLLCASVADPDPGSGGFFTPGSGMVKKSRSGMNILYHFSESLEKALRAKKLKFYDVDPGSGIFLALDPGSGMEKFGSGINIPYPQHWFGDINYFDLPLIQFFLLFPILYRIFMNFRAGGFAIFT